MYYKLIFYLLQGDHIQIIAPTEIANNFKNEFVENNTFTLENFEIEKNDGSIKVCNHSFKLILNATTLLEDLNQLKIANPGFKFLPFAEIKKGVVSR
jgi:hypothetical protein